MVPIFTYSKQMIRMLLIPYPILLIKIIWGKHASKFLGTLREFPLSVGMVTMGVMAGIPCQYSSIVYTVILRVLQSSSGFCSQRDMTGDRRTHSSSQRSYLPSPACSVSPAWPTSCLLTSPWEPCRSPSGKWLTTWWGETGLTAQRYSGHQSLLRYGLMEHYGYYVSFTSPFSSDSCSCWWSLGLHFCVESTTYMCLMLSPHILESRPTLFFTVKVLFSMTFFLFGAFYNMKLLNFKVISERKHMHSLLCFCFQI